MAGSSDYLDVTSFRSRGTGKKYGQKIGSAKSDGKGGFWVSLDALPLPDEQGRVSILISPRQEKGSYAATSRPARQDDDLDSEIPF